MAERLLPFVTERRYHSIMNELRSRQVGEYSARILSFLDTNNPFISEHIRSAAELVASFSGVPVEGVKMADMQTAMYSMLEGSLQEGQLLPVVSESVMRKTTDRIKLSFSESRFNLEYETKLLETLADEKSQQSNPQIDRLITLYMEGSPVDKIFLGYGVSLYEILEEQAKEDRRRRIAQSN